MFVEDIDERCYPIWDTSFMVNENLCCRKQEFITKGIVYLNDLYKNTGDLYGYETFIANFDINLNFIDFYSLMHCIQRQWKKVYNTKLENLSVSQAVYESIKKMPKVCKGTYWKFIQNKNFDRGHCQKWSNILSEDINENEWEAFLMHSRI